MRIVQNSRMIIIVVIVLLAIGGAFYGGRVYQNSVDQPLFTQYTPATSLRGSAAGAGGSSYFGGFSSGGSQVAAALAIATPPGSPSSINNTTSGTGSTSPAAGGGGVGAGGTAPAGSSTDLAGTLVALSAGSVTIKPGQGANQTVSTTPSTTYYRADLANASALATGQRVTVSLASSGQGFSPGQSLTAGGVTIAPVGSLYGYVTPSQSTGGFGFSPAGTITSVSKGSLALTTSSGRSFNVTLPSSAAIYRLNPVASSALTVGSMVTVHEQINGSQTVAANVVGSSVSGTVASLKAGRARGAGGGGFGGGAGAGGGSAGSGNAGGNSSAGGSGGAGGGFGSGGAGGSGSGFGN